MDDNILDFTIDMIEPGLDHESFCELCAATKALESYKESTDIFLEAIQDPIVNKQGFVRKAAENTKDVSRKTGQVVGAVVDAKAGVYHAEANLILKIFGRIAKIIKFMAGKVEDLITSVGNLGHKIASIPEDIRNKIKGSINIYIGVGDLKLIYNTSVINKIDSFVSDFSALTSGDAWSTFFSRRVAEIDGLKFTSNDIKLCKKIHKTATELKDVTFEVSVVPMDDENNRKAYFSNEPMIDFVDIHGNHHHSSYVEALSYLIRDLAARKQSVEKLQKEFGEKMNRTELNQSWAMLGRNNQETITKAMEDAAIVFGVIGNIYKYAFEDVNTINKSVDKITKKFEKPKNPAPTKKA